MKRILLFVFTAFILSSQLSAQRNCNCSTGGWKTFTVAIGQKISNVSCGDKFKLDCTDNIFMQGIYACSGGCAAGFTAVLKNTSNNSVVKNFTEFSFPWNYKFPAAGEYTLELTAHCNKTTCGSCNFHFTVTCDKNKAACSCDPNGWQKAKVTIGNKKPAVFTCDTWVNARKNESVKLESKFVCIGKCATRYRATLWNNSTNKIIKKFTSFSFPWLYRFASSGKYRLEVTPICNGNTCVDCNYYFEVK